jgi:endonuclease/exonuclease/phosphatase family metal-dependent hydrolase
MGKTNLKLISLNVRGLNNAKKRKAVFQHLHNVNCDIAFLQETFSSFKEENIWTQEWGGTGYFVHGTKHSCGVAILIRKNYDIEFVDKILDKYGRYIVLKVKVGDLNFNLINVYSPSKESEKAKFISYLAQLLDSSNITAADNTILGGDWNITLDAMDKMGGTVFQNSKAASEINTMKDTYNLVDIWRLRNGNKRRYTWRQKSPRVHCRLDYFLISNQITDLVTSNQILPSILSDHSPIELSLRFLDQPHLGRGHWKLNVSLLNDHNYIKNVKEHICQCKEQYDSISNTNLKWELMKYEIRKVSIDYSKKKKKESKNRKNELEKELDNLEKLECQNNDNIFMQIDTIKEELEAIYKEEAQGAIIRSRTQWAEEGEKSTAYFFNLEKSNATKRNIRKIDNNGNELTNQEEILKYIKDYYENLYKKDNIDLNHNLFNQTQIETLSVEDQNKCEGLVSFEECTRVLDKFSKNKTPGNDGLPIEFYRVFWTDIGELMVESFNYSFQNELLTTSQRQAIITLLEKPGKDRHHIKNWRPISLLNVDYKILTKCLSERLQNIIHKLIHHSQTGFIKGRSIFDNLRTILDIVEERDQLNKDGLLISIDFEKAFDSLSWEFLNKALKTYNFGSDFIKWVQICYTDISSCVVNYKQASSYFDIRKGVRQGDPLSPYLFILATEIMSIYIRNNKNIRGLRYGNSEIKLLSYADDTTVFLQDENDAKYLFKFLNKFEKCSGLKMNRDKTEGFWLGVNKDSTYKPLGIKWSTVIKILGIFISYNKDTMTKNNFDDRLLKIKNKFNMWKKRDLTIYGKILIIKTFALSQILYTSTVLHIPDKIVKEIQNLIFCFLWNGKTHKVKRNVVIQEYLNGGCKMIDIEETLKVQKVKWIKWYFQREETDWKKTMKKIIGVDNLEIFLKSNFEIPPRLKVNVFYYELLKTWRDVKYKKILSKEDVLSQYLWYNSKIRVHNKTAYNESFIQANLIQIKDIIKDNMQFKDIQEMNINNNLIVEYIDLLNAIPLQWKQLLLSDTAYIHNSDCLISIDNEGKNILDTNFREIYNDLVFKKIDKSKSCTKLSETFDINDNEWKQYFMLPHNSGVTNKVKELQYKIIHSYVATNKLLYKMNIKASPRCNFCFLYHQDIQHLIYECMIVKNFWFRIEEWLLSQFDITKKFCLKNVMLGSIEDSGFLNKVVLHCKYYILKCKYQDCLPNFELFTEYAQVYLDLIID